MKTIDIDRGDTIRLFNSLAVEIGAQCNRTCVFCPVRPGDREDEFMGVAMIEKIATELHDLKYSGRIAPYIYNEPMRDRRIFDIMRYLSAAVPRAVLMVSTNGDYFKSVEDIIHLFSTGVRQIVINIYSASDTQGDPARREHGRALAERRHKQIQGWIDTLDVNQTASGYRPPVSVSSRSSQSTASVPVIASSQTSRYRTAPETFRGFAVPSISRWTGGACVPGAC